MFCFLVQLWEAYLQVSAVLVLSSPQMSLQIAKAVGMLFVELVEGVFVILRGFGASPQMTLQISEVNEFASELEGVVPAILPGLVLIPLGLVQAWVDENVTFRFETACNRNISSQTRLVTK